MYVDPVTTEFVEARDLSAGLFVRVEIVKVSDIDPRHIVVRFPDGTERGLARAHTRPL